MGAPYIYIYIYIYIYDISRLRVKSVLLMKEENITIFPTFCTGTSIAHFVKEKTLLVRV